MASAAHGARRSHALAVAALGLGLSGCGASDAIPALERRAQAAWTEVQAQHRRRADLIPRLVEAVSGVAMQEREVLTQAAEARARASGVRVDAATTTDPQAFGEYQEAQDQLSNALRRLLATLERYPALKASASFLAIRAEIEGSEARIAMARRDYADAVQAYNSELRTLRGRWIATMFHPDAKPLQTFTATSGSDRPSPRRL